MKATDYRIDLPQIVCMQAMRKFLDNLKPINTYLCFTHCDESPPTAKFIKDKLGSLKKFGHLDIPPGNVIKFDKTKESLEVFIDEMVPGEIRIAEDLEEALD